MNPRRTLKLLVTCLILSCLAGGAFAQQDPKEKLISIDIKEMPVKQALEALFKNTGLNYSVDRSVSGLLPALTINDVPFSQALKSICKAADLVYRFEGGIYTISRKPGYDPWQQLVNIEFNNTPLPSALDSLFKNTVINYTLDSTLSNLNVTAVLKYVTLERALSELARAAHIAYKIDGNVVTINALWGHPDGMPPTQIDQPRDLVTEVIQLQYLDPGEVAPLVMKPGLEVRSITGGKLMLRGPAPEVETAKKLVNSMDTENALPRVINIKLTIKEYHSNLAKPIVTELDLGAVEGQPVRAELSAEPTSLPRTRPTGLPKIPDTRPFSANLTPTVNEKGEICLTGDISFRWDSAGDPGASDPLYGKGISISRCLQPDKEQVIAGFTRTDPDGKTSKLEVSAVARFGEGRVRVPHPPVGGYGGYGGGYRVRPPSWATLQPGEPSKQPQPGAQPAGPPPTGVQAD